MTSDTPEQKESINFHCRHCNSNTRSEVIASIPYFDQPAGFGSGGMYRYRLVTCSLCNDVSLLLAEYFGTEGDEEFWDNEVAVYPAPLRLMSPAIPKTLQACFLEARACYQAKAYTATAFMCRRALELLAVDRGVQERNLATSLATLKSQGDIDQRLFDWCDELRLAGNEAVHGVTSVVSQGDAQDMSELAEAIIDYIYVFQARYLGFKNRRQNTTP